MGPEWAFSWMDIFIIEYCSKDVISNGYFPKIFENLAEMGRVLGIWKLRTGDFLGACKSPEAGRPRGGDNGYNV